MSVAENAITVYPVTNLNRKREFCESTLGFKATHVFGDEKTGMVDFDIGVGAPNFKPSASGGAAALKVDDFGAMVSRLREGSGKFVAEPTETSICHVAVISDPAGHTRKIHKRKAR